MKLGITVCKEKYQFVDVLITIGILSLFLKEVWPSDLFF
jgi:hypothetical protein